MTTTKTTTNNSSRSKARSKPQKTKPKYSPDERRAMIAEAAYYRAEQRGFNGGQEEQSSDWLEAEAEIEKSLG